MFFFILVMAPVISSTDTSTSSEAYFIFCSSAVEIPVCFESVVSSSAAFAVFIASPAIPARAPPAAVEMPLVAAATFPDASLIFPNVCETFVSVTLDAAAAASSSLRLPSVEIISRWSALYCSECLSTPFLFSSSSVFFRVSSLVFVCSTCFPRSSCFCRRSSVLDGSSFRSFSTSFSSF